MKDDHQTVSLSLNNDSMLDVGSLSVKIPHIPLYEFNNYYDQQEDDENGLEDDHQTPISSSSTSANSCNYDQPHQQSHHQSLINNFQSGFRPLMDNEDITHLHTTSNTSSDYNQDSCNGEWFYADANVADPSPEFGAQQKCFNKRPHVEEDNMATLKKKKQRTPMTSKKSAKPVSTSTIKNPQSAIAKNRRERISNKLKILQDLVPNGSKVDLVTMLEKAIGYVKFLQLQIKILATDEFWPSAAGGKAPDISQVREAIDAILSSQRSSSS
ncbi:putative transcription factor bHLH086 [Silene latifolia]|uniref:putative transcription factor bHLH086 n=1 Tax=Silene latifolia TaxID=37657 RepID=UPI003D7717FE